MKSTPPLAAKGDANPVLSQFVLYAERSITLGDRSHIEDGDVGVRSAVTLKGGASQIIVGSHGKCRNLFSPSTQMAHDAEARDVLTDAFLRNPDTELKGVGIFPAAAMPALPWASASGTGADVAVERKRVKSLPPGAYGAVTLDHDSVLKLAPGQYTFASIRMEQESKLLGTRDEGEHYSAASGRVDVRVIGELWMDEDAEIGPRWDDARARDFTIEVTGTDPTEVVITALPSPIQSSRPASPPIRPPWSPPRTSFRRSQYQASVSPRATANRPDL